MTANKHLPTSVNLHKLVVFPFLGNKDSCLHQSPKKEKNHREGHPAPKQKTRAPTSPTK